MDPIPGPPVGPSFEQIVSPLSDGGSDLGESKSICDDLRFRVGHVCTQFGIQFNGCVSRPPNETDGPKIGVTHDSGFGLPAVWASRFGRQFSIGFKWGHILTPVFRQPLFRGPGFGALPARQEISKLAQFQKKYRQTRMTSDQKWSHF